MRIQKHRGIVGVIDEHSRAIVEKLDNVHFDHHYQWHDHNDPRIYDQMPTIHVQLICGNPETNNNFMLSTTLLYKSNQCLN